MYDTLNGLSMAGERTRFEEFGFRHTEPGSQSSFTAVTNVNVISRTQNSSSQVGFCTVNFQVALQTFKLIWWGLGGWGTQTGYFVNSFID